MGKETSNARRSQMHIYDEHLAHTEMKTRLKRRFWTVDLSHVNCWVSFPCHLLPPRPATLEGHPKSP